MSAEVGCFSLKTIIAAIHVAQDKGWDIGFFEGSTGKDYPYKRLTEKEIVDILYEVQEPDV